MEEQIENIAQAQAEERQTKGRAPAPAYSSGLVTEVPEAVIGRALTSGSNHPRSIERIVAFMQKGPTGSAAASFMEQEYGTGGKGLSIGGKEYALWFDHDGLRIAPGRTTNVPGCTLVPWVKAGALAYRLLKDGMFATQDKIDAARENEYQELAVKIRNVWHDQSEEAVKQNFFPRITELCGGSAPDSTEKIAELISTPEGRREAINEIARLDTAYQQNHTLIQFAKIHNTDWILRQLMDLEKTPEEFKAVDGFAPAKGSFITQDEIDGILTHGSGVSEQKLRIYSQFARGYAKKERVEFLKKEYGTSGRQMPGIKEWNDSKGMKLTHVDDFSGTEGYDTIRLPWSRVDKRIGKLIDVGRYLSPKEQAFLPTYEKVILAREIHAFYSYQPENTVLPYPGTRDYSDVQNVIMPALNDSGQVDAIFNRILDTFTQISPEAHGYDLMKSVVRDMAAFQRGEYSLFTPLPEDAQQTELRKKQTAKRLPVKEAESITGGELEIAARALSRKSRLKTREKNNGQLTFNFGAMRVAESYIEGPPTPPDNKVVAENSFLSDLEHGQKDSLPLETAEKLEQHGFVVSDEMLDDAMAELDGEADNADAIVHQVEETLYRDEEETILSQYDLGYGHMGNGLTVWNRLEEENGDYKTIAHIAPDRTVAFYGNLPELIQKQIQEIATTTEPTVSATQEARVFSTPAQTEPVQEQPRIIPTQNHAEKSYVELYRESLDNLVDMVRKNILYSYLWHEDTDYSEAKRKLDSDVTRYIAKQNPALRQAYSQLPMFREWLIEDILKFTYEASYISDYRDAIARHAADSDIPEWALELGDTPIQKEYVQPEKSIPEDSFPPQETSQPQEAREREAVNQPGSVTVREAAEPAVTLENDTQPAEKTASSEQSQKRKPGRTFPELSYRAFTHMFPKIADGTYTALKLQARAGMMPLHVERIGDHEISIAHYYRQNGDFIADPEMTFRINHEKQTLEPLTFQQPGLYQRVYPESGRWIPKLRADLNRFANQWFHNIEQQEYIPERAVMYPHGERTEITFVDGIAAAEPNEPENSQPEVTGTDTPNASKHAETRPEPDLTPNVEEYLNLKAQYPDKLIGVQVGGYFLYYGKDAEEAAPALGAKLQTREIPGLGETFVTGGIEAWQSQLRKLLERGHSVVLARPAPERPEGPYEIVKERDIADFIPIGMELTIDERRMKIDSVNYETGRVSLMDMAMSGIYPIFRDEPVAFVREYVEEAQQKELEDEARLSEMLNTSTVAYEQSQRELEQTAVPAIDSGELDEAAD